MIYKQLEKEQENTSYCSLDPEWVELIAIAKAQGLTVNEVKEFLVKEGKYAFISQ